MRKIKLALELTKQEAQNLSDELRWLVDDESFNSTTEETEKILNLLESFGIYTPSMRG
jgi:hypothetical protein